LKLSRRTIPPAVERRRAQGGVIALVAASALAVLGCAPKPVYGPGDGGFVFPPAGGGSGGSGASTGASGGSTGGGAGGSSGSGPGSGGSTATQPGSGGASGGTLGTGGATGPAGSDGGGPPVSPTPDAGTTGAEPTGVACGNAQPWMANGSYMAGDHVTDSVPPHIYECKPFPFSGWCPMPGYEPGKAGTPWMDAWMDLGPCP
jgi:hypothetical protein